MPAHNRSGNACSISQRAGTLSSGAKQFDHSSTRRIGQCLQVFVKSGKGGYLDNHYAIKELLSSSPTFASPVQPWLLQPFSPTPARAGRLLTKC